MKLSVAAQKVKPSNAVPIPKTWYQVIQDTSVGGSFTVPRLKDVVAIRVALHQRNNVMKIKCERRPSGYMVWRVK